MIEVMEESVIDPIAYPHVQIGDETFEVMFRVIDAVKLYKHEHIDLFAPLAHLSEADQKNTFLIMDAVYIMLEYGLRHTGRGFLKEELMARSFDHHPEVNIAVGEARKKALDWAIPKTPPQAQSQTAAA